MKKWSKLLIAVLLVVCVISPIFTTASCETNPIYDPTIVDDSYLSDDVNDNWLLKLLASFVYTVASWAESTIGNLLAVLTGSRSFPWADNIVFNAVPVLDVNFLNPATNSYMAMASEFIQKIYWTMFTIALSLFGVLVLITAIKLAISTIASDKAKYKQALTSWVLGFVMLWTIHFLMAFLFYLNEQLVVEASRMASVSYDAPNYNLTEQQKQALANAKQQVNSDFTNYINGNTITYARYHQLLKKYEAAYEYLYFTTFNNGTYDLGLRGFLEYNYDFSSHTGNNSDKNVIEKLTSILDCVDNDDNISTYINDINASLEWAFYSRARGPANNALGSAFLTCTVKRPNSQFLRDVIEKSEAAEVIDVSGGQASIKYLKAPNFFTKANLKEDSTNGKWKVYRVGEWSYQVHSSESDELNILIADLDNGAADEFFKVDLNTGLMAGGNRDQDEQLLYFDTWKDSTEVYYTNAGLSSKEGVDRVVPTCVLVDLGEIFKIVSLEKSGGNKQVSYITNLAKYFKINANKTRVTSTGKIVKQEAIVSNQIMYAILVVQSIMLFIAYIKRLFFVLLLSMMAPLVVVLDFFQKFGK